MKWKPFSLAVFLCFSFGLHVSALTPSTTAATVRATLVTYQPGPSVESQIAALEAERIRLISVIAGLTTSITAITASLAACGFNPICVLSIGALIDQRNLLKHRLRVARARLELVNTKIQQLQKG